MRTNADGEEGASQILRAFCFPSNDCNAYNKPQDYPKLTDRRVNAAKHGQASIPKARNDCRNTYKYSGREAEYFFLKGTYAQKECVCIPEGESPTAQALKFSQSE